MRSLIDNDVTCLQSSRCRAPCSDRHAAHKVPTPADWKQGQDVIITGAVTDDQAKELLPGYVTVKPYLRTTKQPGAQG